MTSYERLALSDKAKGIMPADIAERPDAIKLWAAIRKNVHHPVDSEPWFRLACEAFVAGWDASAGRVSEDRR
jgi:hypothetical protein